MGPEQILLLWVRVDREVTVVKGLSIFFKALGLERHHQMV